MITSGATTLIDTNFTHFIKKYQFKEALDPFHKEVKGMISKIVYIGVDFMMFSAIQTFKYHFC